MESKLTAKVSGQGRISDPKRYVLTLALGVCGVPLRIRASRWVMFRGLVRNSTADQPQTSKRLPHASSRWAGQITCPGVSGSGPTVRLASATCLARLNYAYAPLQDVTLTHRPCAISFLCPSHGQKQRPTLTQPYHTPARTPRCYPAQCSTARSPPPTRIPLSSDGSGLCISSCPISPFRPVRGNMRFSVRNARIAGRDIARSLRCRGRWRPGAVSKGKGRIRSWWKLCSGGRGL